MIKHIATALLALSVVGCTFTPIDIITSTGIWVLDATVEGQTGKGVVDNAVSGVVGKDCKLKNVFSKDEVCKDNEEETNTSKEEDNASK